jgi:acyl-coenzyme A thioesterase PaaI-like protein
MEFTVEMIQQYMDQVVPFLGRTGLKVLDLGRGHVKLMAPLEGNQNHFGAMYAGALFTLGEVPFGAIFFTTFDSAKFFPLVKEMTIQFKRPARSDVTVEVGISDDDAARISAEAEVKGKAEFVLESEILDTAGEVVAACRGVYQLRVHPK